MNHWLGFIISTAVIVVAGIRLTTCADKLSDELQLGKVWIGVALLGLVTSLPEAISSLTAIVSLNAYDLAIGNLLGSNNLNLMLIVGMDLMYRQGSVTNAIHPNRSHKVSAGFAMVLAGIVAVEILGAMRFPVLAIGWVSPGSLAIAACYFWGMRSLAKLSSGESVISPLTGRSAGQNETVTRMTVEFLISTTLVIAGAIWLARSADAIAQSTGLGGTFFGSIFLALVTSLPEMVVTISALRLGSLDLAIGNIFGSNMVNVFILSICDLASTTGPVIAKISPAHIVTVILSIAMTAIAIKGIYIKNKRTFFRLGWDTWAMTTFFIGGTALLYQIK